jgi:hypothetical protein
MYFCLFIFGPSVESIWHSYMYVIVDKLKENNVGENFKLCVNCAIPTMSNNETMAKEGYPNVGKCHEVLKVIIIFISIFVTYSFMQTF